MKKCLNTEKWIFCFQYFGMLNFLEICVLNFEISSMKNICLECIVLNIYGVHLFTSKKIVIDLNACYSDCIAYSCESIDLVFKERWWIWISKKLLYIFVLVIFPSKSYWNPCKIYLKTHYSFIIIANKQHHTIQVLIPHKLVPQNFWYHNAISIFFRHSWVTSLMESLIDPILATFVGSSKFFNYSKHH